MNDNNRFIRFDWAAKRMLRDKANFGVLEGLLTVLIGEKITIEHLLESESNQESADDKFNRVDIKALNSKGEVIIVEIQLTRQLYYLERILYGVSKAVTEHISLGKKYDQVKKVYSINILYFDLGKGGDYLYHGTTHFVGVHTGDELQVNTKEKNVIRMRTPSEVFPEYFIIRVNEFNKVATTPLEEWMEYLKEGYIRDNTSVPGLEEARKKLQYMSMSQRERAAYDEHLDAVMVQNDVLDTYKMEGLAEGHAKGLAEGRAKGLAEGLAEGHAKGLAEGCEKGRAEGRAEGLRDVAVTMKSMGIDEEVIAKATGLTIDEVKNIEV